MVRIIKTELEYFKNVQYGEIKYMNYGCVEKNFSIESRILQENDPDPSL